MTGRLRDRLVDLGYGLGWSLVQRVPESWARGAFRAGAAVAVRRDGRGVRQLRANLRVATGGRLGEQELDALTARALASYARYWQEAFRLPVISPRRVVEGTEVVGLEHVLPAAEQGRGIVFALPHSGNWDAAGVWLVDFLGGEFLTVAERVRPESLYDRFVAFRASLGIRVLPLTGGERPSATVLREWVAAGGSTCLLVDRDLGSGGLPVTLFGRPATMPGGPGLLAAQTGAALVPVHCSFTPAGWRVVFCPEVVLPTGGRLRNRVATAMQQVADAFTETIGARPEDWHVLGPIWPDVPPDPPRGRPRPRSRPRPEVQGRGRTAPGVVA
ncbi:phosphatidylinositol mannoside acyltransferase [Modestobacter sp. I12A-02628]|uniref:Phosphatidylinositol mannoside acyltransferase n=1 Tax=Goekera deserti TaxID=2497753 RepID=A0A7K3WA58_9ACTN|nr:phosphatidylinositol mannoside acyltransferase [Goekera deserti]NDI47531.1 phosphatidylinositol mannoside acyltransferase [Goekera deserti]NEL53342.1 phosphatidylinositol mannoside acyltransferase [Goekera deserti]